MLKASDPETLEVVTSPTAAPLDPVRSPDKAPITAVRNSLVILPPGRWLVRTGIPLGLLGMVLSIMGAAAALSDPLAGAPSADGPWLITSGLVLTGFGYYRQSAQSNE